MTRRKMPRKKQKKKLQSTQPPESTRLLEKLPGGVASVITFAVGILGLITFWPRSVAMVASPVDPNDPFSATVTVTNTGPLPLRDVGFLLALRSVDYALAGLASSDPTRFAALEPLWFKPEDLQMDKGFEFPLNRMIDLDKQDLRGADIAIAVRYKLPVFPFRFIKVFAYKAARQSDGNFYWYKYAAPDQDFDTVFKVSEAIKFPRRTSN